LSGKRKKRKAYDLMTSWVNSPNIQKRIPPVLLKLFQKIEEGETLPNSVLEHHPNTKIR